VWLPDSLGVIRWWSVSDEMPKITALRVQGGRSDRVSVSLDGKRALTLQNTLAIGLHKGQELTDEEIRELRERDTAECAYERVLHYLSFRPRSAWEVRHYLQKRGVDSANSDSVLSRLQRAGLVDDLQFARFWVDNRESFRPRGKWALRVELQQKGIAREVIDSVVDDVDEEANAMKAARSRGNRLDGLDEGTFRRRLFGFLRRRGFSSEVSRSVTTRLWDEFDGGQETDSEQRA